MRASRKIERQEKDVEKLRKDEFKKLVELLKKLGFDGDEIVEILLIIES